MVEPLCPLPGEAGGTQVCVSQAGSLPRLRVAWLQMPGLPACGWDSSEAHLFSQVPYVVRQSPGVVAFLVGSFSAHHLHVQTFHLKLPSTVLLLDPYQNFKLDS